jgi:hypothetical protein
MSTHLLTVLIAIATSVSAAASAAGATAPAEGPTKPAIGPYPADAGLIDVTKAPYNAKGDGQTDDTAAIQKALDDNPSADAVIYLPAGTYLISDTLKWGTGGGGREQKRTMLEGMGPGKTIIKLKDSCAGFSGPKGKAMIWTGAKPAQRFRNSIRHLTVDTGKGNAGAIGVQYIANNQGNMHDVVIRDGDNTGLIGLDLGYTDEQGPCLIYQVVVEGFKVGVSARTAVDSITIEHLMLKGQREAGLRNDGQCISIRGIKSDNKVPAVINSGGASLMTLIDCEFTGSGPAAVVNEKGAGLLARNVKAKGYEAAIAGAAGLVVSEYSSHKPVTLFDSPARTLGLPIEETPDVAWDELKDWAGPHQFGGVADGKTDCTAALQKAIDSGKGTIYFPKAKGGKWIINGSVKVGGNVRRITGCEAVLGGKGGVLEVVDGSSPVVRFEQIDAIYNDVTIVHNSKRTVVISGVSEIKYAARPGAGKLFMEDYVVGTLGVAKGQSVWARQLNCEAGATKITNDGGNLWILGYKTERHGTLCITQNGGKTEILGGFAYATAEEKTMPMFINDNSSMTITMGEACFNGKPFKTLVEERRGSETKKLEKGQVPGRAGGSMIVLYSGIAK